MFRFRIVFSLPPLRRGFSSCPFQILGLKNRRIIRSSSADQSITYEQVRTEFRKLALQYHPDTTSSSATQPDTNTTSGSCAGNTTSKFFLIREAFEAIAEGPNGTAVLRDEHSFVGRRDPDDNVMDVPDCGDTHEVYRNEEDINPLTLREVADVAKKMNPGGLDKGGMWQYANMIRKMAEENRLPPLRVGGGDDTQNEETWKRLGRRRKRK